MELVLVFTVIMYFAPSIIGFMRGMQVNGQSLQ